MVISYLYLVFRGKHPAPAIATIQDNKPPSNPQTKNPEKMEEGKHTLTLTIFCTPDPAASRIALILSQQAWVLSAMLPSTRVPVLSAGIWPETQIWLPARMAWDWVVSCVVGMHGLYGVECGVGGRLVCMVVHSRRDRRLWNHQVSYILSVWLN